METYASNPNASCGEYLVGATLGFGFGAANPFGEFASMGGALVGGAYDKLRGGSFLGTGFQAGGLVGGLAGGFGSAARAAARQGFGRAMLVGSRAVGFEAAGMATGGGVGYYLGGTTGALHGATLGMFSGGLAHAAAASRAARVNAGAAPGAIERSGGGMGYATEVLEGGSGRAVSGHGEYRFGTGECIVPEGSSVTLPRDGIRISQRTGQFMETGDWEGLMRAAETNPRIANDIQGMATYLPGARVPNYTLKAPTGLKIYSNSFTVENATLLSDLFELRPGHIDWSACTIGR